MKIYPTNKQKKKLDEFIDTSRYVYNKTLQNINNGHRINFQDLRDLLVTENTKKGLVEYQEYDESIEKLHLQKKEISEETSKIVKKLKKDDPIIQLRMQEEKELKNCLEIQIKAIQKARRDKMKSFVYSKNEEVLPFELKTPKDIRACAVKRCCDAFKSGFSNLKNRNIRHFCVEFKKKKESIQTFEITPKLISIDGNNYIRICPSLFEDPVLRVNKRNKRKLKNIKIENNVDIQRVLKGSSPGYYIFISKKVSSETESKMECVTGIDLGIRTLATCHSNNITNNETFITEYKHRHDLLKKWNDKLKVLKSYKRTRKKHLDKLDKKKVDFTDKLHWDFINDVLSKNDVIFLGDINSHNIVKNGSNKTLNLGFNDLKFYKLKQRLLYKASVQGKKVFLVPEHYTTKTCSSCGFMNETIGSKEVFTCFKCHLKTGRDMNAAKNMKMKGIFK